MTPESLAAHARGVRRLARRLLRDDAEADDVVQEACLAALRRPPPATVPAGPWLARVVRNLVARRYRTESRRRRREREAARPEAVAPDDILERADRHRALMREALALREPYRTTLLLRFFDDLPPREIAARRGLPVATVHTHLTRGLALLRGRLDRRHGGRAVWSAALLPLAGLSETRPIALGALAMSTKKTLALVALLLAALLIGVVARNRTEPGGRTTDSATQATGSAAPTPAPGGAPIDFASVDRDLDLHGRVVGPSGGAIAGAQVETFWLPWRRTSLLNMKEWRTQEKGVATESARDGSFALRLARGQRVNLRVSAPGFATQELVHLQAGERVTVVLGRGVSALVTTVDPDGEPVAGVNLRLFRNEKEGRERIEREARTNAAGEARFDGLPPGAWAYLDAFHERYGLWNWQNVSLPLEGQATTRVAFRRGPEIRGVVLDDETGRPIAGATVGSDWSFRMPTTTDEQGRFGHAGWSGSGTFRIYAKAPGYAARFIDLKFQTELTFRLRRGDVVVGRILGGGGTPVAGALVSVLNETGRGYGTTGADGRFRVDGVAHVASTLVVLAEGHGRYLLDFAQPAQEAGTVELGDITLPEARRIEGRVLDDAGEPAAGVLVELNGANRDRRARRPQGASPTSSSRGTGESRYTDDLGRFRFRNLAAGDYVVTAQAPGRLSVGTDVALEATDIDDVVLRLEGGHELRVLLRDADDRAVPGLFVDLTTEAASFRARSDPRGEARFVTPTPPLRLARVYTFSDPRFQAPSPRPVPPGATGMTVVLERAGLATGVVVGADGQPLPQVLLYALRDGAPFDQAGPFADHGVTTDLRGRFRAVTPANGTIDLVVAGVTFPAGPQDYGGERRGVRDGEHGVEIRIRPLRYDRTLSVHVTAPDGSPLALGQVWVKRNGELVPGANVRTDEQGRALLERLPDGPVFVYAKALPDHPRAHMLTRESKGLVIPDGQSITLRLREGFWIEGRVVGPDGKPRSRAQIGVYHHSALISMQTTDDDGAFSILIPRGQKGPLWLHAALWEKETLLQCRMDDVAAEEGEYQLRLAP